MKKTYILVPSLFGRFCMVLGFAEVVIFAYKQLKQSGLLDKE